MLPPFQPSENPAAPSVEDLRLKNKGSHLETLRPAHEVHANPYFSVIDRAGYFTVEYGSHDVVVIPIIENREIVMVRPYRPVLGDAPLEFPGGGGNVGEEPIETAARELFEEVNVKVADLSRYSERPPFCLSPNRMPRLHHVFVVNISEEEAASMKPEPSEIYSVERFSFAEARNLIASGTIYVAAVAGILASLLLSLESTLDDKIS